MNNLGSVDVNLSYLLHTYPYRETSLIDEIYSKDCGRMSLIAKGARRPKSSLRGALMAFQPLNITWSGKSDLKILNKVEWLGGYEMLQGPSLICGFYLNELLLKLLPKEDPYVKLFDAYAWALHQLPIAIDFESILRKFEFILLKELGYGLSLEKDVLTGEAIIPNLNYRYIIDRGPVISRKDEGAQGVELIGQTLIDISEGRYEDSLTLLQSKLLMRSLINHCLGDQVLHTRQLLRDLQKI